MSKSETNASQIASLIPQVFYDLIGRIIPGAFLLVIGFLLVRKADFGDRITQLSSEMQIRYSLLLIMGILFSYMTGILLGGIGYFIEDILRKIKEGDSLATKLDNDSISYWYDAIQHYDPAAGARLAKLSAEKNMCRVLIVGYVILIIVSFKINGEFSKYWFLFYVASVICSALFYIHLICRSSQLVKNYRCIIKREGKKGIVHEINAGLKEDDQVATDQNEKKKS